MSIIKIGKVAKELNLTHHTLRYYEEIGLIRNIGRDSQDNRKYSTEDIKWIRFLLSLKQTRMPLNDIVRYAELYYSGNESIPRRIELLSDYLNRLINNYEEMKKSIDFLRNKIEFYNNKLNSESVSERDCL